ncbi:MAG: ATP-binding protein [Chloroflexi bacterium]|nr:ATP-binding protein [Chloroflexota bacterium]
MPSPYFIAVDPSPFKLRMFFGRRQEIRAISNYLLNGDSVLLIGERRMGKTFLLYHVMFSGTNRAE